MDQRDGSDGGRLAHERILGRDMRGFSRRRKSHGRGFGGVVAADQLGWARHAYSPLGAKGLGGELEQSGVGRMVALPSARN